MDNIHLTYLANNVIKTLGNPHVQPCGFNSRELWSQHSRVVEIICAHDGGMHSACRGCDLITPVVSTELYECNGGIAYTELHLHAI